MSLPSRRCSNSKIPWHRFSCVAFGCVNHRHKNKVAGVTSFLMPNDEKIHQVWLKLVGRNDLANSPSSLPFWICSLHFDPSDILVCGPAAGPHAGQLRTVRPGAVPSLQLPLFANILTMAATASDPDHNALNLLISFHGICDRLLCPDLASILRGQANYHHFLKGDIKKTQVFKDFCINLFYSCPRAYVMLQKALQLPPTRVINKPIDPFSTFSESFSHDMFSLLLIKVAKMSDKERQCAILVCSRDLKMKSQNKKKPVSDISAVLLMVQGILSNWTHPIAFRSFTKFDTSEEAFHWIHTSLLKFLCIGLKVRAMVLHPNNDFIIPVIHKYGAPDDHYFTIGDKLDKKIYYFYDVALLTKSVHNHLLGYDMYFEDRHVAKVDHLTRVYELDSTREVKLAPQLTQRHVDPANTGKLLAHDAAKVFTEEVAVAMYTYVHFKAIPESGTDTAQLILCISKLRDLLLKKSFYGSDADMTFLVKMMNLFHSLKLFTKSGDMIEFVQFSHAFEVTIQSTLSLLLELKAEGHTFIKMKNLQLNAARIFLKKMQENFDKGKENKFYLTRLNKPPPTGGYRASHFQRVLLDYAKKILDKVHLRNK